MLVSPRRIVAAAAVAGGLTLLAAPAAHAVVDPLHVISCLAETGADITTLIDPAAPGVPAEVPAVHCLQP
ncbi:hypothetical protein FH608_022965 [Nonomuraea phyllanthi]|uniref:Uncharacterized protein n=1 Tax=Nonomuraea phyllanthi TaxID=2219224 RepID=A0A5C4WC02_9ACTN|nr:hypothetical protein [Nonomuraea phyllanthi]KAB8193169.1 hypothetical protein FH608_022965 [Nonomuraea phyllanthi]QFY10969.1 hypothetical protein GBF35_34095 [Nonomuraea phyllanthi]